MVHETRKEGEVLEKVLSQKTGRNVLKKPPVIEIKKCEKGLPHGKRAHQRRG